MSDEFWKCEDCGCKFDEPDVISEPRGEFWGAPCSEDIDVCPKCHSDYIHKIKGVDINEDDPEMPLG